MKRILFEFVGGAFDGKTFDSGGSDQDEAHETHCWYELTEKGKIGKQFKTVSPAVQDILIEEGGEAALRTGADMNHLYEVFDRLDDGTDVLVRARFVGYSQPSGAV